MLFISKDRNSDVKNKEHVELVFTDLFCQSDQQSIVIRCNVQNADSADITFSDQYFLLSDGVNEWVPSTSYMSEQHIQLRQWSWKTLKPKQQCTILLRYDHIPQAESFQFKLYSKQKKHQLIHTINID